tara:strand:+ start:829 stop:1122 length:294 start_codon:yes stop_codon:yes gene_type:complete
VKHVTVFGDIDLLSYANEIASMPSHADRKKYLEDVDEKFYDLLYLLSMQMGICNTIARLSTREKRKKAWEELPDHTRSLKSMKGMVYSRVVRKFKRK